MQENHVAALRAAVKQAGSQAKLAARLRDFGHTTASQQLVSYWLRNGVLIDADWWSAIEFATDNTVTRRDLRPDVFPSHAA